MKRLILLIYFIGAATQTVMSQKTICSTSNLDTTNIIKVSLNRIIENLELYDNKTIDVEGDLLFGFEIFALFPQGEVKLKTSRDKALWISYSCLSTEQIRLFKSVQHIQVIGKVHNAKNGTGHLGMYVGSIEIYQLQVFEK